MQAAVLIRGTLPGWLGYGDGYGDGYGYGYGDGDGYGDGYGDGDGYGYGYGDGYGDGYGYGYGYGDGYGYGYGYGDGYGDGYGSKEYWAATIRYFASKWAEPVRARLALLQKEGHLIAFWRSNKAGKPCNGGKGEAVAPGLVQTIPGPLRICGSGALHATVIPPKWKGDRIWLVALKGEVRWEDDKCGALCREIIGECT